MKIAIPIACVGIVLLFGAVLSHRLGRLMEWRRRRLDTEYDERGESELE
jgi:hypothetical protein